MPQRRASLFLHIRLREICHIQKRILQYVPPHGTISARRRRLEAPPSIYVHGSRVGGENAISCTAPSKKFGKIERPDIFRIGGRRRTLIYGQINYAALPTARRRRPKSFAKLSLGCVDAVMCPSSSLCGNPLCHRRGEKLSSRSPSPSPKGRRRGHYLQNFSPRHGHTTQPLRPLCHILREKREGGGDVFYVQCRRGSDVIGGGSFFKKERYFLAEDLGKKPKKGFFLVESPSALCRQEL